MCASTMQNQAAQGLLFDAGFRIPVRHDFDERILYPLQTVAFGRLGMHGREGALGQFGLVPAWVDDVKGGPKFGRHCCNARSESVFDKPSFREAILHRRAVMPVSDFYEFPDKETPLRRRFKVHRRDHQAFWLAAVWERSERYNLESVSLLTTEPMKILEPHHSRSPIILEAHELDAWMDTDLKDPHKIRAFLKTSPSHQLVLAEEPWGKDDPNLSLF
jgi:putative SOS response-associated peptidase YedK